MDFIWGNTKKEVKPKKEPNTSDVLTAAVYEAAHAVGFVETDAEKKLRERQEKRREKTTQLRRQSVDVGQNIVSATSAKASFKKNEVKASSKEAPLKNANKSSKLSSKKRGSIVESMKAIFSSGNDDDAYSSDEAEYAEERARKREEQLMQDFNSLTIENHSEHESDAGVIRDNDSSPGASCSGENPDFSDEESDGADSEEDLDGSPKSNLVTNNSVSSHNSDRKPSPIEREGVALVQEFKPIQREEGKSAGHAVSTGRASSISDSASAGSGDAPAAKPAKRGSVFGTLVGALGFSAGEKGQSIAQKPPTPPQNAFIESERKRLNKVYQDHQKEQEEIALALEPQEAKNFRKTAKVINDTLILFADIFHGEKFLLADHKLEHCQALLVLEIESDEQQASLNIFEGISFPEETLPLFEKIVMWKNIFLKLNQERHEIFRFYAQVASMYPYSLQQLFKLNYSYSALEKFSRSKIMQEFTAYMRREGADISIEEKDELKEFVDITKEFLFNHAIVIQMLKSFQATKEHVENLQKSLRNSEDLDGDTKIFVPAKLERNLELAQQNFDRVTKEVQDIPCAISAHQGTLDGLDKGSQEYIDLEIEIERLQENMKAAAPDLEEAKKKLTEAADAINFAIDDAKEMRAQQKEMLSDKEQLMLESSDQVSSFVREYASENPEKFSNFSAPIQAYLPDVSVALLNVWLENNPELKDNKKICEWLAELISPETRNLTMTITINDGIVEVRLRDDDEYMLEDFFIAVNGPARGTVLPSHSEKTVSEKINAAYHDLLTENTVSNFIQDIANVVQDVTKNVDKSAHATKLMLAIRDTRIEYNDPDQVKLVLPGIYLLLYLMNGPEKKEALDGSGFRFIKALVQVIEKEYNYNLPARKEIYNGMLQSPIKKGASIKEAITEKLSLLSGKEKASYDMSAVLAYIFSDRTEDELSTDKSYPYKFESLSSQESEDFLQTLQNPQYMAELERLIKIETKKIGEIDRKRLKRIRDILNMLALRYRLELVKFRPVQLLILKTEALFFYREVHGLKKKILKIPFVNFQKKNISNFLDKDGVLKNEMFLWLFFDTLFAHFYTMHLNNQTVRSATTPNVPFIDVFFQVFPSKVDVDYAFIQGWVQNNISALSKVLGWFSNDELEYIFSGTLTELESLRAQNHDTMEKFNLAISVDKIVNKSVANVQHANELFILIACQEALRLEGIIQETGNSKMIVLASRHSWFWQLRFLEIILVEECILPKFDKEQTASVNRTLEREMLANMFNHMVRNLDKLSKLYKKCVSQGRTDIVAMMSEKSNDENTKGAILLIVVFFAILFAVQSREVIQNNPEYGKLLLTLSEHFKVIAQMMGFELEEQHRAVIFGMAVYFISTNQELLLPGTHISIQDASEPPRGESAGVIAHSGKLGTAVYFSASSVKLISNDAQVLNIFSDDGAAFFAKSVRFSDPAEETQYTCAKNALKKMG